MTGDLYSLRLMATFKHLTHQLSALSLNTSAIYFNLTV